MNNYEQLAKAFEELQTVLKEADKKQAYQHDCICELTAENEELKADVKQLEPKRGEWEPTQPTQNGIDNCSVYKCSVCGSLWYGVGGYIYCPNCGAKMEVQE